MTRKVCVFNRTRQSFLSLDVTVADTHIARLVGLLGKLRANGGLWVVPCQGIHTIGMLFPVDVVYLDGDFRVIHVIEHLGPFRIAPIRRKGESLLELPTRTIYASQTAVGDELLVCSPAELEIHWKAQRERHAVASASAARL